MTRAEKISNLQLTLCREPDSYARYDAIITEVEAELENEEYRLIAERNYKNGSYRRYIEFVDGSLLSIHRQQNGKKWSYLFSAIKTLPQWAIK